MPWFAAVPAALGGIAGAAGTTAAAAAPALASAAGALGSALGSAGGAIGSGLGSAASGLGSALSSVPSGLASFGSGLGSALESGVEALGSALPSFGGGGEAGILEGLGQAVPQGVELVGPQAGLTGGEAGMLFPQSLNVGTSALPASFGGPSGTTTPMSSEMLSGLMQSMGGAGEQGQAKDKGLMEAFSPGQMMQGILDPISGFLQPPPPGPQLQMPERRPIQTADFNMNDRLASLVRAFQIQS